MSDFTFDEKENYSLDDVKDLLKQHRNVVYAESKKDIEPKLTKLTEYETKIKEYENKINSFEEQQLFSNIKDTKKVNLIKNLMSTDNYKSLSKQEAFNKINEDYKDFLIDKSEPIKQENKQQDNSINPTDLILQLHNNSLDHFKIAQDLKNKAITQGMTNQKELEDLVEITRNEAFQSIGK
ncbi:hypothetical protein [Spiroplasma endosymbiont of Melieria omissa]|uniref:hypothetical protein n=1 Tax=Spiroplasma endosymbiont of Melieria omissa TaxID=3139324 RepID=UPI003CCB0A5A